MIISIESNIGAGKTTLINKLKHNLKDNNSVIFMEEPVNEWTDLMDKEGNDMLSKFYNNKGRYSFSFQVMVFITIFSKLRKLRDDNPNKVIITERSLLTSKEVFAKMLYENEYLEETEYLIFNKLVNEFIDEIPVDYIVYLKSDPELCKERIVNRGREGEENITLEYLVELELYHNLLIEKRKFPVLELNARELTDNLSAMIIDYFF